MSHSMGCRCMEEDVEGSEVVVVLGDAECWGVVVVVVGEVECC